MATKFKIEAAPREVSGKKAKRLLNEGLIPGIVYGAKIDSQMIQLPDKEFLNVFHQAGSTNLIDLKVGKKTHRVLIKDIDYAPIGYKVRHVGLFAINLTEEQTLRVPVVLEGDAPAVKMGGALIHVTDHADVRCLADNIPDRLVVDISHLEDFNSAIRLGDVPIPEGVTLLSDPDTTVVTVAPPKTAEQQMAEEAQEAAVAEAPAAEEPAEE